MRRLDGRTVFRAFRAVRDAGLDLFAPEALSRLPDTPGWASLRLPSRTSVDDARVSLLEALRALAHLEHSRSDSMPVPELVATLPTRMGGVQDTRATVRSLVQQARHEILLIGFSISDGELVDLLHRRAMKGIRVTVVGDREKGRMDELRTHWPAIGPKPRLLRNVEPGYGDPWSMHAKALVIDAQHALVGSANFTRSGMAGNIELGLKVQGPTAVALTRLVDQLADEGWLVAV